LKPKYFKVHIRVGKNLKSYNLYVNFGLPNSEPVLSTLHHEIPAESTRMGMSLIRMKCMTLDPRIREARDSRTLATLGWFTATETYFSPPFVSQSEAVERCTVRCKRRPVLPSFTLSPGTVYTSGHMKKFELRKVK
jgi:hypothetical protein